MVTAFLILLGMVFACFGRLIWKKKKVSLLHSYHYDKVSQEDKGAFCTLSGVGIVIVGIGLILSGIATAVDMKKLEWGFFPFAAAFVIGLIMLILAEAKYNR